MKIKDEWILIDTFRSQILVFCKRPMRLLYTRILAAEKDQRRMPKSFQKPEIKKSMNSSKTEEVIHVASRKMYRLTRRIFDGFFSYP